MPNVAFIPVIESLLEDEDEFVRQVAEFAYTRETNKEAKMPEIIEMINKLKTFALFEGLGTRELHALATITREQEFKPQDIVIRAGEENHSIYLILSGRIATFHDYGTPDQKEVRIAEAGGYLNFIPAFLHQPAVNTSVAGRSDGSSGASTEPVSRDYEDLSPDRTQSLEAGGKPLEKHGRHGMRIGSGCPTSEKGSRTMQSLYQFLKTTVIGGLVVLVPVAVSCVYHFSRNQRKS